MTDRLTPVDSLVTSVAAARSVRPAGAELSRRADALDDTTEQAKETRGDRTAAVETERLSGADSAALMKELNRVLEVYDIEATYYVDKTTDCKVVQIKDARNGRLIRQVPSQDFLEHTRTLHELMGLLFDEQI
jgi:uncharacterized FlaG/YvyC family protein